MKKYLGLALAFGFLSLSQCFADEVQIPYPLDEKKFLKEADDLGLDLHNEYLSDGFIKNEGQSVTVYSFYSLTPDDLKIIQEAASKSHRKR